MSGNNYNYSLLCATATLRDKTKVIAEQKLRSLAPSRENFKGNSMC